MRLTRSIPVFCCSAVLAGALALGLSACGEKTPPKPAAKPAPSAVQPAAPAEPKQDEMKQAEAARKAAEDARAKADAELAAKVKAALGAGTGINVHRIDVSAANGAVTLFGTADTRAQREKAAQIAAGVAGVKSVENKLAVVAGS